MKTTMNHSRRQLPPVAPHKRKERDETFDFLKPSTPIIRSSSSKLAKPKPFAPGPRPMAPIKPFKAADTLPANNILLAGYLAHEFLTKGTLFGQSYDPAHAKPAPALSAASSAGFGTMKQPTSGFVNRDKGKTVEPELKAMQKLKPKPKPKPKPNKNDSNFRLQLSKNQRYARVSELLKNGAHIPGIVNPSQLARFLDGK
ncbi:uncharacterized protein LOC112518499 [Cynara cardunculus var. scolymus]|uniref:uncharacterized protein LOC112518499 n=1 Tax=Cynara cardunculus var. scolymus TaxID=59895 RepID=UPI000D62B374|nr:uncharacterized protein LOC112518499 [Cynara cardunculus var. scolymus]